MQKLSDAQIANLCYSYAESVRRLAAVSDSAKAQLELAAEELQAAAVVHVRLALESVSGWSGDAVDDGVAKADV